MHLTSISHQYRHFRYIQKDISEKLPNLKTLALTNNSLTELGDIDALAKCLKLEYLR